MNKFNYQRNLSCSTLGISHWSSSPGMRLPSQLAAPLTRPTLHYFRFTLCNNYLIYLDCSGHRTLIHSFICIYKETKQCENLNTMVKVTDNSKISCEVNIKVPVFEQSLLYLSGNLWIQDKPSCLRSKVLGLCEHFFHLWRGVCNLTKRRWGTKSQQHLVC